MAPDRATIALIQQVLRRETHILTREPDLLAPHLYNTLLRDFGDERTASVVQEHARAALTGRSWLRLLNRPRAARSAALTVLNHGGRVSAVAWSADMRCLASGTTNGVVRLWDWPSGRILDERRRTANAVTSFSWAGAELLTSGHRDGTVRTWNLATGRVVRWRARSVPRGGVDVLVTWSSNRVLAVGVGNDTNLDLLDAKCTQVGVIMQGKGPGRAEDPWRRVESHEDCRRAFPSELNNAASSST